MKPEDRALVVPRLAALSEVGVPASVIERAALM
jgi:hypothetical protein